MADGSGESRDIATRVDLTDPLDQVGRSTNVIRDHGKDSGRHGLIDNESPRLRPAGQDQDICGVVERRQLGLIHKSGYRRAAFPQPGPDFIGKHAVSHEDSAHISRQSLNRLEQVEGSFTGVKFPAKHDHGPLAIQVPPRQQFPAP
jgi:hypothetical protein